MKVIIIIITIIIIINYFEGRILAGCYWFCILVWVSTYTANLAAFFTVKNSKTPINSLEDAANSADYQISVLHSSSTYSYFRSAEYELHSRIWHKMQANKAFPNSLETSGWMGANQRKLHFYYRCPLSQIYFKEEAMWSICW